MSLRTVARGKQYRDVHKQTTNKQLLNFTRERERGAPSYDSSVQGHTKQEKERDDGVASYDSSVQGHTRERGGVPECCIQEHSKKGKEGRGERERGGKRIKAPDRFQ